MMAVLLLFTLPLLALYAISGEKLTYKRYDCRRSERIGDYGNL